MYFIVDDDDDDLKFDSVLDEVAPFLEPLQNKVGNKIPSPPLQVIANRHRSKLLSVLFLLLLLLLLMLLCLYSISLISSHE